MNYRKLNYMFVFAFLLISFVSINACTSLNKGLSIIVPNSFEVLEKSVTNFCADKNCDNSSEYICGPNDNGGSDICWNLKNKNKTYYYPNDLNTIYVLFVKEQDSTGKYKSNLDHYRFVQVNSVFDLKYEGNDNSGPPDIDELKIGLNQLIDVGIIKNMKKEDLDEMKGTNLYNNYIFYESNFCRIVNIFNRMDKTRIGNSNWYYTTGGREVSYNALGCAKLESLQKC